MADPLSLDVYEVFVQLEPLSAHQHQFNVLASSPDMALELAYENFCRRTGAVSLWVVKREAIHKWTQDDFQGKERLAKPYRTTEDYKYLKDKWRYYRENPMSQEGPQHGEQSHGS